LNKQWRAAYKGWSSSLVVGRVADISSPQKPCYKTFDKATELEGKLKLFENRVLVMIFGPE
jgi:hypothetical protein